MTTAIIGGGAAGVAAAIAAAERGERVLVLERNRKPLKKLGVTGNGRGNVLNSGSPVYFGGERFARAALARVGYPELCTFFASLGVPLRQEAEGRVYPAALQASVVTEALLLRAAQRNVTFVLNTRAQAIERAGDGFIIRAVQAVSLPETGAPRKAAVPPTELPTSIQADRVIVTVGGSAAPAQGTDGTGYGLLTAFGHRVTPLKPALCALLTDKRRLAGLSGQRVRAGLTLLSAKGEPLRQTEGEVLFGDDAVSGIAAMQLARFYEAGASLTLDFRPAIGQDGAALPQICAFLQSLADLRRDRTVGDWLTGAFAPPVARLILSEAGLWEPKRELTRLTPADVERAAVTVAGLRLPVLGTRGFEQAQVTAGGICTEDFDPETMQSLLCPGLYAAGEVLDVDGDCGGFNLMFAFSSGLLAGR